MKSWRQLRFKMEGTDFIKNFYTELNELAEEAEDITPLLELWSENNRILFNQKKLDEKLRTKIRNYLKERNWERLNDKESKVSVSIVSQKRENVDKKALKTMLKPSELAQVIRTTSFEKMLITNPDIRKRLKKNVK